MLKDWLRYPRVLLFEIFLIALLFSLRGYWAGFDVLASFLIIILVIQILVEYVFTSKSQREENRKINEYIRNGRAWSGQVAQVDDIDYVFPSEAVNLYNILLGYWAEAMDDEQHQARIDQEHKLVVRRKDNEELSYVPFGKIREFIMTESERRQKGE